MQLNDLAVYDSVRCQIERPLLYAGLYTGRDLNERKNTPSSRKDRPMRFMAGPLDGAFAYSPKSQPVEKVEIGFMQPWIHLDLALGRVEWETAGCIDFLEQGDIVSFNREEFEWAVRVHLKKWRKHPLIAKNKQKEFYESRVELLTPYFTLIDLLEKQHRRAPALPVLS